MLQPLSPSVIDASPKNKQQEDLNTSKSFDILFCSRYQSPLQGGGWNACIPGSA